MSRGSLGGLFLILLITVVTGVAPAARGDEPATKPAIPAGGPRRPDPWPALHDKYLKAFNSGDPTQIAAAISELRATAKRMWPHREFPLQLLMQVKRYDDLEQMAVDLSLYDPGATAFLATAEKMRAQAFIAQNKGPEALSAARSYYDIALLKDSSDAINLIALALALAKPDDPTIAKRFKSQQIAWASVDPTSQPLGSLGDPILPTIPPDSKPYEGSAEKVQILDYPEFVVKGNLLLLEGKAKDARDVFERAEAIVPVKRQAEAIENVARAIRAQSGCVGPANAYVLQKRNEQQ